MPTAKTRPSTTRSKWERLPTEAINVASTSIDTASVSEIIDLMTSEDRKVVTAVHREKPRITHGVEIIAQSLRKGGRVVFVGAGTSGRLGVVEATEMGPTFGVPPHVIQAIMAGGKEAVFQPKEGVEDHYEDGIRALTRLRISRRDVIIGVSASGMTPFVRGALTSARKVEAKIIFVTACKMPDLETFVDLVVAPVVGPEVIAGSTRLKAGTATKMVLNMLTTIAMVRVGKTYGNLMVDVQTGSEKLKDRARRIISTVTGLDYDEAGQLLRRARWNVKVAIVMERSGLNYARATGALKRAHDSVRLALGEGSAATRPETKGRKSIAKRKSGRHTSSAAV